MTNIKLFFRKKSTFSYLLLAPSILLLIGLVGYPMIYNIYLSFHKLPANPLKPSVFVGIENYASVLGDSEFYSSLGTTLLYTLVVTSCSTILGLVTALLLNRPFKGKKIVNAIIISPYVMPMISIVFCWKYLFNPTYGLVNYATVYWLKLTETVPLWFDNKISAFILVSVFAIWKYFPYSYMSLLAILQSIDRTLYEVAQLDGTTPWQSFWAVTMPSIKPVLATIVSLRAIWTFYAYAQVQLLTSRVDILGIYLYEKAFNMHDFGTAAAICVLLFFIIFTIIMILRKKVFKDA